MSLSNKLYHLFESPKLFGSLKEDPQVLGINLPSVNPLAVTIPKKRVRRKPSAPRKKKGTCHCCCSLPDLPEPVSKLQSFETNPSHQQTINQTGEEKK